jgi:hypothetical protein
MGHIKKIIEVEVLLILFVYWSIILLEKGRSLIPQKTTMVSKKTNTNGEQKPTMVSKKTTMVSLTHKNGESLSSHPQKTTMASDQQGKGGHRKTPLEDAPPLHAST